MKDEKRKLGLIVNPVAGLGGAVALKGSDGEAVQAAALARGAVPRAGEKAARALAALRERLSDVEVLAFGGRMGDPSATLVGEPAEPSSGLDTRRAAVALRDAGAALLLVVGGDGTVRDVLAAVGDALPILGVPAGVKMQSAVFATSPRHAGEVAAAFLAGDGRVRLMAREVMDIDEEALRAGRLGARLHGFATVPVVEGLVQNPKAGQGPGEAAALDGLCGTLAAEMRPGRLYVLGPGTNKQSILRHLGLDGTLLGVDAVQDRKLVGRDLDAAALEALVAARPTTLVVSVMGGHGCLFGRGNQQIAPLVIARVRRENIEAVASLAKLAALGTAGLFVDTGDPAVDALLEGFIKVRTGPATTVMMRVRG